MTKEFFEKSEFETRWKKVRAAMEAASVDLLMVIAPTHINYLIGTPAKGYQELEVLFFPLEDRPLTIFTRRTEVELLRDQSLAENVRGWGGGTPEDPVEALLGLMKEKGFLNSRIGLEVPAYYLHPYEHKRIVEFLGESLVMDATDLVGRVKLIKSPAEIGYIRQAAGILDIGLEAGIGAIREGNSERDVSAAIHCAMLSAGSDIPSSPMNFLTGPRSAYAHGEPSDRVMKNGDFMHIQYGAHYRRYCSTLGRQFCLGAPTAKMQEVYDVVRDAGDACIAEMKPGVRAQIPHEAARKVIAGAGMERYRIHFSGYALGAAFPPTWVEPLFLESGSETILEPGMVIAVEPPVLGREDGIGARLIDNLLITADGAEILSNSSRDLIVLD